MAGSAVSTQSLADQVANATAGAPAVGLTIQDEIRALTPQLRMAIPKGALDPERFVRMMFTELRKTPALLKCTRESLLGAMMQMAQLGLEVGNTLGEAYLIPYKNECTLQIGYKGYIALAYRGGIIMESREVYENDDFEFDFAAEPPFHHRWKLGVDRGKVIGFYGTARLPDGRTKFHVMSLEEIELRRARAGSRDSGPWKTDYNAMCRKTVIRAMVPQTPMSAELALAAQVDDSTVTMGKTHQDLTVTYAQPEQPGSSSPELTPPDPLADLRQEVVDALNAIQPDAERHNASAYLLKTYGPVQISDEGNLRQALKAAQEWGVPAANDKTGEVIDTTATDGPAEAPSERQSAMDEIIGGLAPETQTEAREAVEKAFEPGFDPNSEEVMTFLDEWLSLPRENPPEAAAPSAANLDVPEGLENVSQETIDRCQGHIKTWDTEICDRILTQFGQSKAGNLASKRTRLLVVLAPLVEMGDPAAVDLF